MEDETTPWVDNIVWQRPDGGVSIDACAPGTDVKAWAAEQVKRGGDHAGWKPVAFNIEVPTRCEFRNAMTWDGKRIVHDMARARDLRRAQLRIERAPLLAALDIEYQRADEAGDAKAKAVIAAKKQALRDITADPRLDKAQTLDDLRAVKCP